MDIIKVFVACHKPGPVYQDNVYTPIHVGRELSKYREEMSDMIGDDTGENISRKNPYYSELTAQYWAWKNVNDVKYIGFCHYRRFFNVNLSDGFVEAVFKHYDVVMTQAILTKTVECDLTHYVTLEDISIFLMILKNKYPEYERTAIDYLWNNEIHQKNMLICRKELFDDYAEWIFGILEECEKYIQISPYMRGKRVFGYLGEFFMPVFFLHNHCKIYNTQYIEHPDRKLKLHVSNHIKSKLKKAYILLSRPLLNKPSCFEDYYVPEVVLSLNSDKINPNNTNY